MILINKYVIINLRLSAFICGFLLQKFHDSPENMTSSPDKTITSEPSLKSSLG